VILETQVLLAAQEEPDRRVQVVTPEIRAIRGERGERGEREPLAQLVLADQMVQTESLAERARPDKPDKPVIREIREIPVHKDPRTLGEPAPRAPLVKLATQETQEPLVKLA
jgi:hypothetical protein